MLRRGSSVRFNELFHSGLLRFAPVVLEVNRCAHSRSGLCVVRYLLVNGLTHRRQVPLLLGDTQPHGRQAIWLLTNHLTHGRLVVWPLVNHLAHG